MAWYQTQFFKYTLYGVAFGCCFPVGATLMDLLLIHQLDLTWKNIAWVQAQQPLHWIIDTAPFFLGLFSSFAGRRQDHIALLAKLPEENPHVILRVSGTGGILYSNPAGRFLLDAWDRQVGQNLPGELHRVALETLDVGTGREVEIVCAGHVFSLVFVPIEDAGYVNVYGRDMTVQAQAEDAMRKSENRLKTILETSDEGFWLIDNDTVTLDVNASMCEILGRSREEIVGKRIFEFVNAENGRIFEKQIELRNRGVRGAYEIDLSRPDGTRVPCLINATLLLNDTGLKTGSFAMVTDITERKQAETALREAKEAAESANRAKSVFLANMSHELRTPLNAILGFAQLMRRDSGLMSTHRESLDAIHSSGEYLLEMVNDVLDMSRIEAGRVTYDEAGFDLYRLLEDLEGTFRPGAKQKKLRLVFERSENVPRFVKTDAQKLRHILVNFLSNAVKFTREGGVVVRVGYREEKPQLVFEVEDTGPGIAEEEMDALFEAFTRKLVGEQAEQGTGLGLPISRVYARLMGGDIQVRSKVGQGSTFRVDVRVGLAEAEPADDRRGPEPVPTVDGGGEEQGGGVNREALSALPPEWVAAFHEAATSADSAAMLEMLDQVRAEHGELARALEERVENFLLEEIIELTRPE